MPPPRLPLTICAASSIVLLPRSLLFRLVSPTYASGAEARTAEGRNRLQLCLPSTISGSFLTTGFSRDRGRQTAIATDCGHYRPGPYQPQPAAAPGRLVFLITALRPSISGCRRRRCHDQRDPWRRQSRPRPFPSVAVFAPSRVPMWRRPRRSPSRLDHCHGVASASQIAAAAATSQAVGSRLPPQRHPASPFAATVATKWVVVTLCGTAASSHAAICSLINGHCRHRRRDCRAGVATAPHGRVSRGRRWQCHALRRNGRVGIVTGLPGRVAGTTVLLSSVASVATLCVVTRTRRSGSGESPLEETLFEDGGR